MPKKTTSDLDRWRDAAAEVGETQNPLRIPYDVFLKEAGITAGLVHTYWEPADSRPGLSRVKARLPRSTADDIQSLIGAVQIAQTDFVLIVDPAVADHGQRARELVDELESAIEFLLDDDVEEPADAQLAKLQEVHSQDGQRSSALVQALRDYAGLATQLKDRLVEVDSDFDPKRIAEATKLADLLSASHAAPDSAASAEAAAALTLRNQLLVLLTSRVNLVRRTIAHVFRNHPSIVREATSSYERRRRAAARRAKVAKDKVDGKPTEGGGG